MTDRRTDKNILFDVYNNELNYTTWFKSQCTWFRL